jgi:hypothetical protein
MKHLIWTAIVVAVTASASFAGSSECQLFGQCSGALRPSASDQARVQQWQQSQQRQHIQLDQMRQQQRQLGLPPPSYSGSVGVSVGQIGGSVLLDPVQPLVPDAFGSGTGVVGASGDQGK